jgi:hypothetical protein
MLIGRIAGWIMVLAGASLLLRYFSEAGETGRFVPVAMSDFWHGADAAMVHFMAGALLDRLYSAMFSTWVGALLIIFGLVLIYGCRENRRV